MKPRLSAFFTLVASLLILVACSETPPAAEKKAEPVKPPAPVTGEYALYQMYGMARAWAPDLEVLDLRSVALTEVKSEGGKTGAWEATFVSPSKRQARSYTYSVVESSGNLHQGVFASPEESYTGPSGQTKPFPVSAVKIDSDKAYEVALKHGADYAEKNPNVPMIFMLQWTPRHRFPAWRVIWGDSVATSNYSVFVDASEGTYVGTML
jgi:hypothetical protein